MIEMIAALDENGAIGYDNKLLWNLKNDMRMFKHYTKGGTVVMGRKTYESIGKILPNRLNIILTKDENYTVDGGRVCHSINQLLNTIKMFGENIIVIGGTEIYKLLMPYASKITLTRVKCKIDKADTFFPKVDSSLWLRNDVNSKYLNNKFKYSEDEDEYPFEYEVLTRYAYKFNRVREIWGWMSNFSDHKIEYGGKIFPRAEHLFLWKRIKDKDFKFGAKLISMSNPKIAKNFYKKFVKENPDKLKYKMQSIEDVKALREILKLKIKQHPELKSNLTLTPRSCTFIEDTTYRSSTKDSSLFWGMAYICADKDDRESYWVGKNMLGECWKDLRDEVITDMYYM